MRIRRSVCLRAVTAAVLLLMVSLMGLAAQPARATPLTLLGEIDPLLGLNQYSVEFPPSLGGETINMAILGGTFEIVLDGDAGTAELLSWDQSVEAITISGMSTGPMTVVQDPSVPSTGTFDAATSEFTVTAGYLIHFDDTELSALGFTSPFVLTSVKRGCYWNPPHGIACFSFGGPQPAIFIEAIGTGSVAGETFSYICTNTARISPVGGTTELLTDDSATPAESAGSSGDSTLPIAATAGLLFALAGGGLLVRRRLGR